MRLYTFPPYSAWLIPYRAGRYDDAGIQQVLVGVVNLVFWTYTRALETRALISKSNFFYM